MNNQTSSQNKPSLKHLFANALSIFLSRLLLLLLALLGNAIVFQILFFPRNLIFSLFIVLIAGIILQAYSGRMQSYFRLPLTTLGMVLGLILSIYLWNFEGLVDTSISRVLVTTLLGVIALVVFRSVYVLVGNRYSNAGSGKVWVIPELQTNPGANKARDQHSKSENKLLWPLLPLDRLPVWVQPPIWEPEPTLVIGLGGTGRHVLTHLKKRLRDAGAGQSTKHVRFLLLDAANQEQHGNQQAQLTFGDVTLDTNEVLELNSNWSDLSKFSSEMGEWFPTDEYRSLLSLDSSFFVSEAHQHRPMARAALVQDVKTGAQSRLLQRLQSESHAALSDERQLQIVIVGSICGGFGSAVLADVAYLARRVGRRVVHEDRGINIKAYLAIDEAFARVSVSPERQRLNTAATIRELERFQLAQEFPSRITYDSQNRDNDESSDTINWRLLDNIYLFDTPDIVHRNRFHSETGIFPTMADAISLILNKAGRRSDSYQNHLQATIDFEATSYRRVVVSGTGSFIYRLPMYDLISLLKALWSRRLIHYLLSGAENSIVLDAQLNRESDPDKVAQHVQQFLVGLAGYHQTTCPPELAALGWLIEEGFSNNTLEMLDRLSLNNENSKVIAYRLYLVEAIIIQLNGLVDSPIRVARGAKLGYVLHFLDHLLGKLLKATYRLTHYPTNLTISAVKKVHLLAQLLLKWQTETQAVKTQLMETAYRLSQQLRPVYASQSPLGLYEKLNHIEAEHRHILADMDTTLSRNNIYSEEIVALWYDKYLQDDPFFDDALQRLYWKPDELGQISLYIRTWNEMDTVFTEQMTPFIESLDQLATYATRQIWEKENIATVLANSALHPAQIDETTLRLMSDSAPLLNRRIESGKSRRLVMGINPAIEQAEKLEDSLRTRLQYSNSFARFDIADPYVLSVWQTVDLVPINAIQSLNEAKHVYQMYNLSIKGRGGEPTAVFSAERIALELENRMSSELHVPPRLLQPIITSALGGGRTSTLYPLALAAGWIEREGTILYLKLPSGLEAKLTQARDFTPNNPDHLFAVGYVRSARLDDNQIVAIYKALTNVDESILKAWGEWTPHTYRLSTNKLAIRLIDAGIDTHDLVIVTTLIVHDQLRTMGEAKQGFLDSEIGLP